MTIRFTPRFLNMPFLMANNYKHINLYYFDILPSKIIFFHQNIRKTDLNIVVILATLQ